METTTSDTAIYLPSEIEMMAARGAISSLVGSIAQGNLEPRNDVLDGIILSVVRSLRWRPVSVDDDKAECGCGRIVNVRVIDGQRCYEFHKPNGISDREPGLRYIPNCVGSLKPIGWRPGLPVVLKP